MSGWEDFKDDVQETLHSIGDGWRSLWRRASNALTHFSPTQDSPAESGLRWGLITAELVDRADELELSLEIPGLDRNDINIELNERNLAISGEKRFSRESKSGAYVVSERAYGHFRRAVTLPCDVQADRVEASYRDGILTITLPKRARPAGKAVPIRWG